MYAHSCKKNTPYVFLHHIQYLNILTAVSCVEGIHPVSVDIILRPMKGCCNMLSVVLCL